MTLRITVIEGGFGNMRSVNNLIEAACPSAEVSTVACGSELDRTDVIVLPGVGSFDASIKELRNRGLADKLSRLVLEDDQPLFAVCLGMQLMFEGSEEGSESGLGWFPGCARKIRATAEIKSPHMGWNSINVAPTSRYFDSSADGTDFYFLHEYFLPADDAPDDYVSATTNHGGDLIAAVERDTVLGVQFHPEKSQDAGLRLFSGFVSKVC